MSSDAALALIEAYLGINGYFVLTDLEVHTRKDGAYRALTDIDVVAVRHPSPPGPAHYAARDGAVECLLVGEVDPALRVATDRCDVIIGEVKRGEASLNPMLRDRRVIHAALRRVGDVFGTDLDGIVDGLINDGRVSTPRAEVRLVAFGSHGSVPRVQVLHHDELVDWLNLVFGRHRDLYEITAFPDPTLSLLSLAARVDAPLAAHPEAELERMPPSQEDERYPDSRSGGGVAPLPESPAP